MKFITTIITEFISSKYKSITTLFLKLICDSFGVDFVVEDFKVVYVVEMWWFMVVVGQSPGRELQGCF